MPSPAVWDVIWLTQFAPAEIDNQAHRYVIINDAGTVNGVPVFRCLPVSTGTQNLYDVPVSPSDFSVNTLQHDSHVWVGLPISIMADWIESSAGRLESAQKRDDVLLRYMLCAAGGAMPLKKLLKQGGIIPNAGINPVVRPP